MWRAMSRSIGLAMCSRWGRYGSRPEIRPPASAWRWSCCSATITRPLSSYPRLLQTPSSRGLPRRLAGKRASGLQQAGLEIKKGRREAVTVNHQFPHDRQRGRKRIFHLCRSPCRNRKLALRRTCVRVAACAGFPRGSSTCRSLIPRLRAASRLCSSSAGAEVPRLCHGFSMLNAASASRRRAARESADQRRRTAPPSTKKPCTITSMPGIVAA